MVSQVDSLLRVRLDTLPAAELRRLAEPWCGRTEASDLTSAADTLTPPQGLYATAQERVGAFTQEGLRAIAERWRHAREIFRDVDAATMFGDESSLSYGAQRDTVTLLSDRLSAADAPVQPASDMITHAADSLHVAGDSLSIAGDSLSLTGDSVFVAGDSLSGAADTVSLAADTLSAGAAGAADGHVAAVVAAVTDGNAATLAEMAGDVVQNLLVAVVVFLYFFCLYRYFDDVRALFGSVFRRSVAPSERMLERRRSEIFYGFLGKLFLIGTCTLGAIASLWADRTVAWEAVGPYARVALPFAAMAAFVAVVAVQYAMLAVAGGITRSWPTMAVLLRIRLIYFVLATVIVLPPVLMWQMNGGTGGEVWLRVACLAAAVAVVMYVRESVTLFNSKKISILHWILYLCIVEIMPFTLLWQIVVRMG
ncbi:MAG: hypothetical protein BHV70_03320 [Bacteroidales bacterium 55_9]|nr:MAG: hypothetical protein BHV70_03320 [Bacteroidales bacterium 55_9]